MTPDDIAALLDEMDAERRRPGQRCHACRDLSRDQRSWFATARERGHAYASIAKKANQLFNTRLGEGTIKNHVEGGHDR